MPGITDVNRDRVSTNTMLKRIATILILLGFWGNLGLLQSCKDGSSVTQQIQTGPVNIIIDLNLSSYQHLINPGEFEYFDGGIRGVMVVHDFDDTWYAFERTCAYQPGNACSKIWADSQNLQLKCGLQSGSTFTSCCDSKYNFAGFPISGAARGRLAMYKIQRNGNILQIYN